MHWITIQLVCNSSEAFMNQHLNVSICNRDIINSVNPNFCLFFLSPSGSFRFASLQSTIGKSLLLRSGKKPDDISSIVLVTEDEAYFKSDAVLRIASKLDGNPVLPVVGKVGRIVPSFMRNTVYDFVATNRYRFGEADQCRLDFGEFDDRFVEEP